MSLDSSEDGVAIFEPDLSQGFFARQFQGDGGAVLVDSGPASKASGGGIANTGFYGIVVFSGHDFGEKLGWSVVIIAEISPGH